MGIFQDPNGGVPRCIASCIGTFLGITEKELTDDAELRRVGGEEGNLVASDNKILNRFGCHIQQVSNEDPQGDRLVLACHPKLQNGHCFLFRSGIDVWDPWENNPLPWSDDWIIHEVWKIWKIKKST